MALLQGHPIQSFVYHPLVLYSVGACVFLLLKKLRSPGEDPERPVINVLIVALIIVIANFTIKNILLYYGIDLLI